MFVVYRLSWAGLRFKLKEFETYEKALAYAREMFDNDIQFDIDFEQ